MDVSLKLERECVKCKRIRKFKTLVGYKKSKNTFCKSCSNSISFGGEGSILIIGGKKKCFECKEMVSIESFTVFKNGRYHSYCNECKKLKFREYQKTSGRFKRHGITKEIYEQMYKEQDGKCFICKISHDNLYIDHNHTTTKIRKLLCRECNSCLGLVKENTETLKTMINYLETHDGNIS